MDKKNVTDVIETLTSMGVPAEGIEVAISKGIQDGSYIDDRPKSVIPPDKFKQVMDKIAQVARDSAEVDISKSATKVASGLKDTLDNGGKSPEVSNAELKRLVEINIEKSETLVRTLREAVLGIAELLTLNVAGVQGLESQQAKAFKDMSVAIEKSSTRPVLPVATPKAKAAPKAKATDDRELSDEPDEGQSIDIFKSQLFKAVHAEIGDSNLTDGRRRHLLGQSAAVLSQPSFRDLAGLRRIAADLQYNELLKSAPQAT